MNHENVSETVKSEEALLLPEETLGEDIDIPSEKSTCVKKSACDYCIPQDSKKTCRCRSTSLGVRQPLATVQATVGHSELFHGQEGILKELAIIRGQEQPLPNQNEVVHEQKSTFDCPEDQKCHTNLQCEEFSPKCEVSGVDSDNISCFSEETKDSENNNDTEDNKESGDGDVERTKLFTVEQFGESCDSETKSDVDSPEPHESTSQKPDVGIFIDSVGENCKRTRRTIKRKWDSEDSCPICGLTIRYSELENHFTREVENLSKISRHPKKIRAEYTRGVNTSYVQVKCNRENRLSAKVEKYTKKPKNQIQCPVCSLKLSGSDDDINNHVLNCVEEDEFSDVDVTNCDDSWSTTEEYEIGDETRVRAISLIPGGYRALHGNCSRLSKTVDDTDEVLNVDVDDSVAYGRPQYTELDVIHNASDSDEEEKKQLRKAIIDPGAEANILESRKWSNSSGEKSEKSEGTSTSLSENTDESNIDNKNDSTKNTNGCESAAQDIIVSSLKEKLKLLDDQNKTVKCLICLESYTKPVVSTSCWHVYCEECWLMTMGVKKLCPQCNMIVFPSDLRRIYL